MTKGLLKNKRNQTEQTTPLLPQTQKVWHKFWVPPRPKSTARTSSTDHLSGRDKQASSPWAEHAVGTGRPARKSCQETFKAAAPRLSVPTGHTIFTALDPASVGVRSHLPLGWWESCKKRQRFATNHFSQRRSIVFATAVQTWRHWTLYVGDLKHL